MKEKRTITLPNDQVKRLDELAEEMDTDRSEVVEIILEDTLQDDDRIEELFPQLEDDDDDDD